MVGKGKGEEEEMLGPWPLPQATPQREVSSTLNPPPPQQDQPVQGVGTGQRMDILFSPAGEAVMTGLRGGL